MILSEYVSENRKATVSRYGETYTVDFYLDEKHIQKSIKKRIIEAEQAANDFVQENNSPIFLSE